jgi:FtsP/CotA-like multicopper oxidase with cupredoxin domain
MRFSDHADPDTPYMYHCHLLAHEDSGMMGQFAVVRPGEQVGTVDHHHH